MACARCRARAAPCAACLELDPPRPASYCVAPATQALHRWVAISPTGFHQCNAPRRAARARRRNFDSAFASCIPVPRVISSSRFAAGRRRRTAPTPRVATHECKPLLAWHCKFKSKRDSKCARERRSAAKINTCNDQRRGSAIMCTQCSLESGNSIDWQAGRWCGRQAATVLASAAQPGSPTHRVLSRIII